MLETLIGLQIWIREGLTASLSAFAETRDWSALLAVLPAGVLFGAIHALTPGHSKSVLASYLLGSRLAVVRGAAVAAVLALTHVGTAVLLALTAAPFVTRTIVGAGQAPALELVSRGFLLAIGLWLIVRAWRGRRHVNGEGLMVGFVAGLVPCPLTLFVMFYSLTQGVPEAGATFAVAMALGVLLTLLAVALLTLLARDWAIRVTARYGASIDVLARSLDGLAGALLVFISVGELWD